MKHVRYIVVIPEAPTSGKWTKGKTIGEALAKYPGRLTKKQMKAISVFRFTAGVEFYDGPGEAPEGYADCYMNDLNICWKACDREEL